MKEKRKRRQRFLNPTEDPRVFNRVHKKKKKKKDLPFSVSSEIPPSRLNSPASSAKHFIEVIETYEEPIWLVTFHVTERRIIEIGTG